MDRWMSGWIVTRESQSTLEVAGTNDAIPIYIY